jgi:hypothetical protein
MVLSYSYVAVFRPETRPNLANATSKILFTPVDELSSQDSFLSCRFLRRT